MNTQREIELEDYIVTLESANAVKAQIIDDLENQLEKQTAAHLDIRDIAQRLWQMVKEFDLNAEMDTNYEGGRVNIEQLHDWMVLRTECEVEFDGLHKPFLVDDETA